MAPSVTQLETLFGCSGGTMCELVFGWARKAAQACPATLMLHFIHNTVSPLCLLVTMLPLQEEIYLVHDFH